MSSLRKGHATIICIVPVLPDDLGRVSTRVHKHMSRHCIRNAPIPNCGAFRPYLRAEVEIADVAAVGVSRGTMCLPESLVPSRQLCDAPGLSSNFRTTHGHSGLYLKLLARRIFIGSPDS